MNWNSNDTKYILKRFVIYILIAIAMFIIGTWKASALTDSTALNSAGVTDTITISNDYYSFNKSMNAGQFQGYGNGQLTFSFGVSGELEIYSVSIYKNYTQKEYPCNIGTNQGYSDSVVQTQLITAECNIDFQQSNTNASIVVKGYAHGSNAKYITFSRYMSYYSYDIPQDVVQAIQNTNSNSAINNMNNNITNQTNIQHQDAQQQHQDLQDINNSINNDNITSTDADDFSNNQAFTDSTGLESVIQLPLNMVNSLTSTCQPIEITIPFINYTGTIPCMSTIYQSKFNSLYVIVKLIINGFFVYRLLLKVYELVHNAKQPDVDKLEVIDL